MNAIRNAAAAVNNTGTPTRLGPKGVQQGIIRLGSGVWWMKPQTSYGATFTNRAIICAPGVTFWASDGTSGHMFLVQTADNFSVVAGLWSDTGNGAAVRTMANKTGAGFPVISDGLGGGATGGPRVTATGDPRVPWTLPVDECFSVMVDRNESNWINNHTGFMKINTAGVIEVDRAFGGRRSAPTRARNWYSRTSS